MRSFVRTSCLDPVPGDVVALLGRIDIAAGAEERYRDQVPRLLSALGGAARVESITASNAIEGVVVPAGRARRIASGGDPRHENRSEAEFAGYTAALDYLLHDDAGPVTVGLILHLHRLLLSRTEDEGGRLKTNDNAVVDRDPDGSTAVRFMPVSAAETPFQLAELVARIEIALTAGRAHPLLVIGAFTLDLLCIHPFADGNGRVARLTTSHLMQRAGYGVGRYVSLEQRILESKDAYYDALAASTTGWFDDGRHDVWPWQRYLLGVVAEAYELFRDRVAAASSGGTKQERVRQHVLVHAPSPFSIADLRRALPGISDNTIRVVLTELKAQGRIVSHGPGRGARWSRP